MNLLLWILVGMTVTSVLFLLVSITGAVVRGAEAAERLADALEAQNRYYGLDVAHERDPLSLYDQYATEERT